MPRCAVTHSALGKVSPFQTWLDIYRFRDICGVISTQASLQDAGIVSALGHKEAHLKVQGQFSGCYDVRYEILNILDGFLPAPNCCPSFKTLLLVRS